MNYFLIQAILIAEIGDPGDSFFMQIFVFLLLGLFVGIYGYVKNAIKKHKDQQQNFSEEAPIHYAKSRWRFWLPHKPVSPRKGIVQEDIAKMKGARHRVTNPSQELEFDFNSSDAASHKNPKKKPSKEKNKNLYGGMDLLELDFLLSIVENVKDNDQKDVTIRKLNFNEVLRREKLNQVKSKVLVVYAIDQDHLYGKDIQCQAMGELAKRTTRIDRHEARQTAICPRRKKIIVDVK
jgi:hypothetical protein